MTDINQTLLTELQTTLPNDTGIVVAAVKGNRVLIDLINADLTTKQATIDSTASGLAGLATRVDTLEGFGLAGRVGSLETRLTDIESNAVGTASSITLLNSAVSALQTTTGLTDAELTGLATRLDAADALLTAGDETFAANLIATQADILTKHNAQATQISTLTNTVNTVQSTADEANTLASSLSGTITSAQTLATQASVAAASAGTTAAAALAKADANTVAINTIMSLLQTMAGSVTPTTFRTE